VRVPVLMYHYISVPPVGADQLRVALSVPPLQFEEHLRYLRDAGHTSISLYELTLALQTGAPLPPRPVVITLDDGYRDAYTQAFPLLRRYGFKATLFLITDFIDHDYAAYVTWDQVREMQQAGMEMEAHGRTHPDLRNRDVPFLIWQIMGAREAIEAQTHQAVHFYCYPSGKYDGRVIEVLQSLHYLGAVTVAPGVEQCANRLLEMPRLRVYSTDSALSLAQRINQFMQAPQGGNPCTMTP
jgi:peptidoglycan/xylan/chitin deacetylase (PgdA/CDA1 family)